MHTLVRPAFHALTLLCAACTCLVAAHTVSSVADVWLQPLPSFPNLLRCVQLRGGHVLTAVVTARHQHLVGGQQARRVAIPR